MSCCTFRNARKAAVQGDAMPQMTSDETANPSAASHAGAAHKRDEWDDFVDLHNAWAHAIGDFLLCFGVLEHKLFCFLGDRSEAKELGRLKNLHFKDRIAMVQRFVAAEVIQSQRKQGFDQWLKRLEPIRELRNQLAHGYLLGLPVQNL